MSGILRGLEYVYNSNKDAVASHRMAGFLTGQVWGKMRGGGRKFPELYHQHTLIIIYPGPERWQLSESGMEMSTFMIYLSSPFKASKNRLIA